MDYQLRRQRKSQPDASTWDVGRLRALRRHLGLSQRAFAEELGTRQQTISEWETDLYRPRGTSARLLSLIAERAGFTYQAGDDDQQPH